MKIILVLVLLVGCTKRNPAACCETEAECARLGTTEIVTCDTGTCVNFACVDDGTCDVQDPDDCTAPESCVDGVCMQLVVDAPPPPERPALDVAYPNEWRRSVSSTLPFDLIVIGSGTEPVPLSSMVIKSVDDDHPTATVRILLTPSDFTVAVGEAAGFIAPNAEPLLAPIVSETRVDTAEPGYLEWQILDAPSGTYDIATHLVLVIDGNDVVIDFVTHMVPGPTIFADPEAGKRLSVFR